MKSSAKKVELASVDDLFSTEESRADAQREKVLEIPLSELHPFKDHPFKVKDDEAMMETADSIRQYGVLVPAIARPDPNGGYELVAGHRRHRASELAELSFLKKEEQVDLLDAMDSEQATPSLSQAQRLKKYSQEGHLTLDMMRVIMGEEKKSDLDKITFTSDTLRKYFPRSYTPQRMQETIIKLLEQWQRKRQQQHDR